MKKTINTLHKLRRYSTGYLKDGGTFQFLEIFDLSIDTEGNIINGEVSAMINAKYEVMTLEHFLKRIRPETLSCR